MTLHSYPYICIYVYMCQAIFCLFFCLKWHHKVLRKVKSLPLQVCHPLWNFDLCYLSLFWSLWLLSLMTRDYFPFTFAYDSKTMSSFPYTFVHFPLPFHFFLLHFSFHVTSSPSNSLYFVHCIYYFHFHWHRTPSRG